MMQRRPPRPVRMWRRTAYYREVVADLETRFEEDGYGTEGESWDTYLQRMRWRS